MGNGYTATGGSDATGDIYGSMWDAVPASPQMVWDRDRRTTNLAREQAKEAAILEQKRGAHTGEMWQNVGIGALAQGAALASALPVTATDRHNRGELARLTQLRDSGQLGLSGAESAYMDATLKDPLARQATQSQQDTEAYMANKGGMSAKDLSMVRRERDANLTQGHLEAGKVKAQAHFDKVQDQLAEIERRMAYKGERQQALLNRGAAFAADMGDVLGQARAGKALKQVDWASLMEASGMGPEQVAEWAELAQKNPSLLSSLAASYGAQPR